MKKRACRSLYFSLQFSVFSACKKQELKKDHNTRASFFDSAIESTGMILKYFLHKGYDFKGAKRNISPKILEVSSAHIFFSELWTGLNDILEYWKYSEVDIVNEENGKISFEITDKKFELNNLISNERFMNLRDGWQMGRVAELQQLYYGREDKLADEITEEVVKDLNYLFSTLYFGSPTLNEEISGIKLKEWVRGYELLIDESRKFLKRNRNTNANTNTNNLDKMCLSKSSLQWNKLFQRNGFSKENAEKIVYMFTFDSQSLDLIDCPLVQIDDQLVIIPSLTSQADASRALASNFLNRHINLDFKGPGFEERMKVLLKDNGINSSQIYKRIDRTEYECDIAFALDNELFFVECKAHVQPYTTRQHANHLSKLYKETNQVNRIADFFESNVSIVNKELNLDEIFIPKKIHRILLTTSMVGTPMFVNGVYIIDESSFTMFLDRTPPELHYFGRGKSTRQATKKFKIYEGSLTAEKMIEFLNSPPQIKITEELFREKKISVDFLNISRHFKVNHTLHFNVQPSDIKRYTLESF